MGDQQSNQDFNPETHILCDDGKVYERKIVSATGVAAGLHIDGQPKTALAAALEKAMTEAVQTAHQEGVTNPDEIRGRILAARDKALEAPPPQDDSK